MDVYQYYFIKKVTHFNLYILIKELFTFRNKYYFQLFTILCILSSLLYFLLSYSASFYAFQTIILSLLMENQKEKILYALNRIGINKTPLFGDADSIAAYI